MSRNFGLNKLGSKLSGVDDSAIAGWSLILALALTVLMIAASVVLA